jgi:hypothetical protein
MVWCGMECDDEYQKVYALTNAGWGARIASWDLITDTLYHTMLNNCPPPFTEAWRHKDIMTNTIQLSKAERAELPCRSTWAPNT